MIPATLRAIAARLRTIADEVAADDAFLIRVEATRLDAQAEILEKGLEG
jgi:hypothetical protein